MLSNYLETGLITMLAYLSCMVADHLTHTAFWQEGTFNMSPDHFDVFGTDHDADEHGSSSDYWDHYADVIAEAFAITADDETPFLLTDAELSELSEDVDSIPPGEWDDAIADSSILPPF